MELVGIDGSRDGWVAARSQVNFSDLRFEVVETLDDSFDQARKGQACVAIDVPIGLNDGQPRLCDIEARKLLSQRHKSSVFPTPARCCLPAWKREDYERACRLSLKASGKSLSRQSHGIFRKIREVDELIDANLQRRAVRETHPEVTFATLAAGPLQYSKKTPEGWQERLSILAERGIWLNLDAERGCLGRSRVARDDLIDAAACLLIAQRVITGCAMFLPAGTVQRDARGLRMEIVA